MQTLAARCLAEGHEAELFQARLQLFGGFDHSIEGDVRRGVEIENETTRNPQMTGLIAPGMILNGCDLRRRNQALDAVNLNIGLAVPFYGHQADQVGHAAHRMPLEEALGIDAVRRADDRARPPFEMVDHPRTDLFEITRQVDF